MKAIVNIKRSFSRTDKQYLSEAIIFVGSELLRLGINRKLAKKTELLCEETIVMLAQNASEGAELQVHIRRLFADVSVHLFMEGTPYNPYYSLQEDAEDSDGLMSEEVIRSVLLRSHGDKYKYRNKNNVNHVQILTGQTERVTHNATFIALFLGLLLGLLAKMVLPQGVTEAICTYALDPVQTMFMNALNLVIAPVVFFSIVAVFSQFHDLADFGKLGAKVIGMYLLTTVIAVMLGIGISLLLKPGIWGFALSESIGTATVSVNPNAETGLLQMIVNIVPSNLFAPFLESDTLQVIFLAVICGVALGMIGEYSAVLKDIFEACNSLFQTITSLISKTIPLAVFASVSLMVIKLGDPSLISVLSAGGVNVLIITIMMGIYGLLILLMARLDPRIFFKKARNGMTTSFLLSSSSAAMPVNLRICTNKLGIAPRIANFSITVGSTINMDGACIFLSVFTVFLARAYGVQIPASRLFTAAITIILLSLGAPTVPGSVIICLGIILKSVNVPVDAIALIIAINPILDMFDTMSNTTGDMAAALIVAKSENQLDTEQYYTP
jgi:Na+/H+-dicarboxylate symporter